MNIRSITSGNIFQSHADMITRLSNLRPPRVNGARADAVDCHDLADHLSSIADIFREYVGATVADFNQCLEVGSDIDTEDFEKGFSDIIADYIAGPLTKRADVLAEEMVAAE